MPWACGASTCRWIRSTRQIAMITRGGSLARVPKGIEAARTAGLAVKPNAVALKGSWKTRSMISSTLRIPAG